MTRLMVFLGVLTTFVLVLCLFQFNNLPISNQYFNFKKSSENFHESEKVKSELIAEHEHQKVEGNNVGEEEVKVVEYAPIVDLSSPELVSGSKLFGQCIACHGKGGEGKASQKAPHIGGQYDWYIEKQLADMKSSARINPAMVTILKALGPKEMKEVAAYVSKLPWDKEAYLKSLEAKK